MRMRVLTILSLLMVSSASLALAPLEPQSSIDWPPKAVPKQKEGKVPQFKEQNILCLDCHKDIMAVKTASKKHPNLHKLHLESKKIAYEGKNRDCLVCHEMIAISKTKAPKKEGYFVKGDVYHPNVMRDLPGPSVWKKLVVRAGDLSQHNPSEILRPAEPYIYKPSLKRLVCLECHGPDSKIKTFFGAPVAGK